MEVILKYSGIFAIIVYSAFLFLFFKGKKGTEKKKEKEENKDDVLVNKTVMPLNPEDEDALVACLVAAIECRNEYHRNVRIVSVREV